MSIHRVYYTETAGEVACRDSGNPDLVHIWYEDSAGRHWLCECDLADAPRLIAGQKIIDALPLADMEALLLTIKVAA